MVKRITKYLHVIFSRQKSDNICKAHVQKHQGKCLKIYQMVNMIHSVNKMLLDNYRFWISFCYIAEGFRTPGSYCIKASVIATVILDSVTIFFAIIKGKSVSTDRIRYSFPEKSAT